MFAATRIRGWGGSSAGRSLGIAQHDLCSTLQISLGPATLRTVPSPGTLAVSEHPLHVHEHSLSCTMSAGNDRETGPGLCPGPLPRSSDCDVTSGAGQIDKLRSVDLSRDSRLPPVFYTGALQQCGFRHRCVTEMWFVHHFGGRYSPAPLCTACEVPTWRACRADVLRSAPGRRPHLAVVKPDAEQLTGVEPEADGPTYDCEARSPETTAGWQLR